MAGIVVSVEHLVETVDRLAQETAFSGVVRVDLDEKIAMSKAYGLAHRAHLVWNTVETQFAIASGTKALTALAVVSLIEEGAFELATTARSVLGRDLPLISDDVTVEQLLAHRSGIGDYADEEAGHDLEEYVLSVPVHELGRPRTMCRRSKAFRTSRSPTSGSPTATAATSCLPS